MGHRGGGQGTPHAGSTRASRRRPPPDRRRLDPGPGEIGYEPLLGRAVHAHIEEQRPIATDEEVEAEHPGAERGIDAMNAACDLDRYSPLNSGSRFSANARRPSAASFVSIR